MRTEDLIESLAQDVKPVARHGVGLRLASGIAIGGVGSVALVAAMLGVRPDLGFALQSSTLWMKWGYTMSLALLAFAATARLARPDAGRFGWLWLLAAPIVALASYGAIELAATPRADWKAMWLGESWTSCPLECSQPLGTDLCRAALGVPSVRADPAARHRRSGRTGIGRLCCDDLLHPLPRGVGGLRADLVFARHPARHRDRGLARASAAALVNNFRRHCNHRSRAGE